MDHVDYPHTPGHLYDCPACEARCYCTPGNAVCVYEGEHDAGNAAPMSMEDLIATAKEGIKEDIAEIGEGGVALINGVPVVIPPFRHEEEER